MRYSDTLDDREAGTQDEIEMRPREEPMEC